MDILTVGVPPTSDPRPVFGGATGGALPGLGPGWLLLRNCALGGGGPRVGLALLHPRIGVALVDPVPEPTDTAGRLRRALDARRFPAIFGGFPPIVRVMAPADRSAELGPILAAAFKAQPPLALAGGDAWIGTARAAIEAELPVAAPARLHARRRRAFPWRATVFAAAGGGSAAALAVVAALLAYGPDDATRRSVALASVEAPGGVLDLLPGAEPAEGELTALDVTIALMSAENGTRSTASGSPPPAIVAADENRPGVAPVAPSLPASPAAGSPDAPEAAQRSPTSAAGTSAAAATGTEESEGARSAAMAMARDDQPEPPRPAPIAAEAPAASANGSDPAPRQVPTTAAASAKVADAAAEPRTPPNGAASSTPPDPRTRAVAPQAPATSGRRAGSSAAATPAAEASGMGRCREILVRATMGSALSDGDKEFLRRGCQPRG